MKHIFVSVCWLLTALMIGNQSFGRDDLPTLDEPYLGQTPPGLVPEVFAPGIVSTEHTEGAAAFSPDLKEFYFRRKGGDFKETTWVVTRYKDGRWTESALASGGARPFIAPDGKTMHLGNKYRERTDTGWSDVKSLGAPFEDIYIMRLTASSKGTYYFDAGYDTGTGAGIRYSRFVDGEHEIPKTLTKDIVIGKWEAHPFIAPDESYLIWDADSEGRFGKRDLYISFRQEDGSWGAAINLGDQVNTEFHEGYGSVTPDGKYFFFHRSTGADQQDIFWVDAQILENLRPNS